MSFRKNKAIVLLPIQPRYASAIADGRKLVEFRKIRFKECVSHIVVYSSSPQKKVIGYFQVDAIEEMSPRVLWKRYGSSGAIDYKSFCEYYADTERGVAIKIAEYVELKKPQLLAAINPQLRVPQSFSYLTLKDFGRIRRLADAST